MKRYRVAAAVCAALAGLSTAGACSDEPATPTVPRLAVGGSAGTGEGTGEQQNPNAVGGDSSARRRARLHAAAQCIREHGAPRYQDPLLTADGYVYTDDVALRDVEQPQMTAIEAACGDLIRAATFSMRDQGPPPPRLIQAGVKSAQCLRANGLPKVKDPTVDSRFAPGKGFGLDPAGIPAGGKQDPTVRRALEACRSVLDEEAAMSSLGNLGNA
ncbi:hypothetical protein ACWEOZ_41025 [Actinoplanes sp. NPDC004185]